MRTNLAALAVAACLGAGGAHATEGALGRPISGTGVLPNAGIVPPEPIMAVNLGEIYLDGSISGTRQVPVGNKLTLGLDDKISFTLAGTVQQLGDDRGPTADALNGFRGHDWAIGRSSPTTPSSPTRRRSRSRSVGCPRWRARTG